MNSNENRYIQNSDSRDFPEMLMARTTAYGAVCYRNKHRHRKRLRYGKAHC